jgi:peptidoglycan/LPS O-acetylase OafA/YrhL
LGAGPGALAIWPTVARDSGAALGLNLLLVHAWGFLQEYTWNMARWSISIEWLCYLLFPLLALLLSGRSLIVLLGVAVALQTAIYTAAPVTLLGFLSGTGPAVSLAAGKQALYYFQIFFLGYACFLIGKRLSVSSVPPLLWDALAATVLAVVYAASPRADFALWIPLASAALIFCLAQRGPFSEILLGNAVMRYLGEISYCVYMCHIMAYAVLIWAWYGILGGKPAMWVAFLVAIGVSAVAYHVVEQPARQAIRKWIAQHGSSSIVPPTPEPSLALMTPGALGPVAPDARLLPLGRGAQQVAAKRLLAVGLRPAPFAGRELGREDLHHRLAARYLTHRLVQIPQGCIVHVHCRASCHQARSVRTVNFGVPNKGCWHQRRPNQILPIRWPTRQDIRLPLGRARISFVCRSLANVEAEG